MTPPVSPGTRGWQALHVRLRYKVVMETQVRPLARGDQDATREVAPRNRGLGRLRFGERAGGRHLRWVWVLNRGLRIGSKGAARSGRGLSPMNQSVNSRSSAQQQRRRLTQRLLTSLACLMLWGCIDGTTSVSIDGLDRSCVSPADCIVVGVGDYCPCGPCDAASISIGAEQEFLALVDEISCPARPFEECEPCPLPGDEWLQCVSGLCVLERPD